MNDGDSPQTDRFVHDRLPPKEQWPVLLPAEGVQQCGRLNCVDFLLDRHLQTEIAEWPALKSGRRSWTYGQLAARVSRIAHLMVEDYSIAPGNRVLIRGANSPEAVAIWLAVQKIGAVAVTTMSLLRAGELSVIIDMSQPALVFCESSLGDELVSAIGTGSVNLSVVHYGEDDGQLYRLTAGRPIDHPTCPTLADDISLIGFTSGTTGRPKATIHFHRDIQAICETVGRHILKPTPDDVFIGTAPLAFTFGLGGLLIFPLNFGACAVLHGRYTPQEFIQAIERYRATICFTVPTYYQQMLRLEECGALSSLRLAVSSGEALPLPVRDAWREVTGMDLTEVLGSTEMLHAFAGSTGKSIRSGFIGPAIPGFELSVLDGEGNALAPGEIGRLAVRGPTGCRYLSDLRQQEYVQDGWNLTGDACSIDEYGYVAYHTRYDDMIISAGYNISGLEVENILLDHPHVAECAIVGEPDSERGQIVVAYVVLAKEALERDGLMQELQDHVKNLIAPYKYPRIIKFMDRLPRNESGKIQRFRLRGL